MGKKKPVITEITKRFNETVENIINKGAAANYKAISDAIEWSESGLSTARKLDINVPIKYVKSLEEVYKVKVIFTGEEDQLMSEIMTRLVRLEAHAEISESINAELLAKVNKKSFSDSVGEFRKLVQEATERRLRKLNIK